MKLLMIMACLMVACSLVEGQGFPTANCPVGEHSVLYCPQKAEPSCTNPTVHELSGPAACSIPQCFCNTPALRNEKTGQCVKRSDCPKARVVIRSTASAGASSSASFASVS